jgi:proline iminopeptidase
MRLVKQPRTVRYPIVCIAVATIVFAIASTSCANSASEVPVSEELRQINGTELFVKRMGSGEPILVVHGGPVLEHGYLLPHLAPLAESFELIFFDQRLSGRSAGQVDSASVRLDTLVADIEALRQSLQLGRVHLMGHSWGGLLAMRYAILHPENLRSLILLNSMSASSALWQEEEAKLAERRTVEDSIEIATIRETVAFSNGEPEAIAAILLASFKAQFADRSKIAGLELYVPPDYLNRSRQFGYMAGDLSDFDFFDELGTISVPTLVLYGSVEPAAEISGEALHAAIPNSELVIIPNAGHFPFVEQPDAFLGAVRGFLGSVRDSQR